MSALEVSADNPMESALYWFTLLQGGTVSPDDRTAFDAWYAASPENGKAYARISALWGAPELSEALARSGCRESAPSTHAVDHPRRWFRGACLSSAMAAAILLIGIFAGDAVTLFQAEPDYRTEVGESRDIALSDGSVLKLNTASAIEVDIGEDVRRVRLMEGEGFFNVVRDEARPFVVSAGSATIRVLGTSFAVHRDGARVTVAVESGSVSVQPKGEGLARITLAPGEAVEVAPGRVPRLRRTDRDMLLAWLSGRIVFRDARLGSVLSDLGRYYDGWIYPVGDIGDVRASGNFRSDDPVAVVRALASSAGARVTRLPGNILFVH